MTALPLLPVPADDARSVTPALEQLAEERILTPARSAGYELALLGATVWPQQQMIWRSEESGAWLLVDHRADPSTRPFEGKIPIPQDQLARLQKLDRAGVHPDHVWIAHQLPSEWQEGDSLENLIPPPAKVRQRDELLLKRVQSFVGMARAAATIAASAAAAPLTLVELDPVLIGGVQHPTEPVVVWTLLAQWEWE